MSAGPNGKNVTRRTFITTASGALVAGSAVPRVSGARLQPVGANDRIGVGLIGAGGRGRNHLETVAWLKNAGENISLVAVCDVYRPRMQKAAEENAAKGYMDHRELLADPNVDLACIATPDHIHGYQAIDAVQARKDVYCEKPVTHWRQFELIKKLAREVSKSEQVFQLGTQGMSDSAWHQMRQLVKDGLIGQPIHAECGYFRVGDWGERGMPVDDPQAKPGSDLNWDAFLGDSPKRPFDVSRFFRWRMYEDYAGGPVTDLFPHSFTPVVSIFDLKMPAMAVATGGKFRYQEREIPDTFNTLIDYPEHVTVAVLGTQGNSYSNPNAKQRGAECRIPVLRGWNGTLTVQGREIVFEPCDGSQAKPQRFRIEQDQTLADHWKNLLDCCRARRKDTFSPVDLAYRTQTALIMGMWAFREGKVARFDSAREEIVLAS